MRDFKKKVVEHSLCINLSELRKHGCLKQSMSGDLTWVNGRDKNKVGIEILLSDQVGALRINYEIRKANETNQAVSQRVPLIATPCYYGGFRWWFLCPYKKEGQVCGRKAYKLFLPVREVFFGCRHCHALTYVERQNHSHHYEAVQKVLFAFKKTLDIEQKMKYQTYAGKPTKKRKQYLKYMESFVENRLDCKDILNNH